MLKGKKIILGITGSIAAYKAYSGRKRIYYSDHSFGFDQ